MAWGGSISQVAQNEIVMSAQQRAAAERQLEMLIRQQENARQNAQQTRQLDQRDASSAEQTRQFNVNQSADAARETRMASQFDQNMDLQRDLGRERQRDRRLDLLQRRRVFTMNEQDKALRALMPHAEAMAVEGMFENVEDVIRQFPSLATQAPMLAGRSTAARRAIEGELTADRADADLLNQDAAYKHMAEQEAISSWDSDLAPKERNFWFDRGNTPDAAAVSEWGANRAEIKAPAEAITRDRNRMGRLSPDASGRYSPNTVLPWQPRTSTTSNQMRPVMGVVRQAESAAPATSQFKPGMMVIQGGVTYRFDGQNWLPLQ